MAPSGQSYANHAQYMPVYHFFTSPLAAIYVIWSIVRFVRDANADTGYALLGALALFGVVAVSRLSPLRAQDRLIRLEEQLRYRQLLPAELASQAEATFSPRHYIALRFASDGELRGLVERVIANPAMTGKEIKQGIREWRGDYFRV